MYLNTSALNRPFDDLSAERVRREADAVTSLVSAVERGRAEWVSSEYFDFEVDQGPEAERAERVRGLLRLAGSRVAISSRIAARARELESVGLRGLDALHVAAAEAAGADLLVTTDDRMMRRAARVRPRLAVRVVGPAEALAALVGDGDG